MIAKHPFLTAACVGLLIGGGITYWMVPSKPPARLSTPFSPKDQALKPIQLQFYRELTLPPRKLPIFQPEPKETKLNDEGKQPVVLPSASQEKLLESIRRVLGSEAAGSLKPTPELPDEEDDKP